VIFFLDTNLLKGNLLSLLKDMEELIDFLNNCKVGKEDVYSHTTIQGGKWFIEDIEKFYELMDKYDGYKRFNMIEFPIEECRYVRFDFDFEFDKETAFVETSILKICNAIKKEIVKYCNDDYTMYVFGREKGKMKNEKIYKGGIHIQIPDITTERDYLSHLIRNDLVKSKTLKKYFEELGAINSIESIIDECVYKKNGWVMYGCDKEFYGNAYQIIRTIDNKQKVLQTYKKDSLFNELKKFSFRNKMYPKLLTEQGQTLIQNFKDTIQTKNDKIKTKTNAVAVPKTINKPNDDDDEINLDFVKELVECLTDERSDIYDKWINVCWTLKSINNNLFDIFDEFSKKSSKYDRCKVVECWNKSTKSDRTIGTLRMYAKEDNPEMYNSICNKFNKYNFNTLPIFTDDGFAKDFFHRFKHKFIYQKGILYYFNDVYWIEDLNHHQINIFLSNDYKNTLDTINNNKFNATEKTEEDILELKENKKYINRLCGVKYCQNLIKRINAYLENPNIEFDTHPHLFLFKNKVWDLNQGKFIKPNQFDYMTMTTGYPYKIDKNIDENTKILDKLIKQILPDDEVRELTLQIIASGMYGARIQKFTIFNGGGGNGKGVINKLALRSFGNYACKFDNAILTEKKGNSGGTNCAKNKLNKIRYGIATEPNRDSPLNCGTIKEFTGEGNLDGARGLYQNQDDIILFITTILECNTKPPMKESDNAMARRVLDILFASTFTDDLDEIDNITTFKVDVSLDTLKWRDNMKIAFFHYLQPYYTTLKNNNMVFDIPKSVKARNKKYFLDSNDLYKWFEQKCDTEEFNHIVEDKNGFIRLKDLYDDFTRDSFYRNLTKQRKREYTKANFIIKILEIKEFKNIYKKKHNYTAKDGNRTSATNVLMGYRYEGDGCDIDDVDEY